MIELLMEAYVRLGELVKNAYTPLNGAVECKSCNMRTRTHAWHPDAIPKHYEHCPVGKATETMRKIGASL